MSQLLQTETPGATTWTLTLQTNDLKAMHTTRLDLLKLALEQIQQALAEPTKPACTCERGANLDHWARCEVHGLERGR